MNRQYEFSAIGLKTLKRDTVRCTAPTEGTAYSAVVAAYAATHDVLPLPIANRPPHAILGEIDATTGEE